MQCVWWHLCRVWCSNMLFMLERARFLPVWKQAWMLQRLDQLVISNSCSNSFRTEAFLCFYIFSMVGYLNSKKIAIKSAMSNKKGYFVICHFFLLCSDILKDNQVIMPSYRCSSIKNTVWVYVLQETTTNYFVIVILYTVRKPVPVNFQ